MSGKSGEPGARLAWRVPGEAPEAEQVPAVGLHPELQRRGDGRHVGFDRGLVGLVPDCAGVIGADALEEPVARRGVRDQGGQAVMAGGDLLGPGNRPAAASTRLRTPAGRSAQEGNARVHGIRILLGRRPLRAE